MIQVKDIPITHTHQWHEHRLANLAQSVEDSLAGFENQIQGQLDSMMMEFDQDLGVEPQEVERHIEGWKTLSIFQKVDQAHNLLRSWQASRDSYEDHIFERDYL